MDANTIRDSLLHLAGELDLIAGGPPVPSRTAGRSRRRAMYFFHSHNEHHKLLGIFDNANVLECYRRTESIVPQQRSRCGTASSRWRWRARSTMRSTRLKNAGDPDFIAAAFETILATTPNRRRNRNLPRFARRHSARRSTI